LPGIGSTRSRARDAARGAASYLRTARPLPLLGALCALQVAIAGWFALNTPHNGWVWYSGGDSTEYWTGQWAVAHLRLTQTIIGWGLPVLYSWVPLVTGPTLLDGLPVIVLLQVLVLVPLVACLVWLVADRLYGRLFAWWATVAWIAAPLLLLWGMRRHDYRVAFEQYFLAPHVYGLTNMADLPSVAAILACGWATLRALDSSRPSDGVLAGLLAGLAIGIKPANAFFVVLAALLLASARRPRVALAAAAGIAPALLALAIWKARGLGTLPILSSYAPSHEAAGASPMLAAATPSRYVPWDPHHLGMELHDLSEVFWSVRVLEWIALAGAVGAIRRSPVKGTFLTAWFVAFCLIKGSSAQASVSTTSYFRLTEPGLPAFALLAASIVFLAPRSLWSREEAPQPRPATRGVLAAVIGLVALVPLVLVSAARPQKGFETARDNVHSNEMPISARLTVTATRSGTGVLLSWPALHGGRTAVHYLVFRANDTSGGCVAPTSGARECLLDMTTVGTTRATSMRVPRNAATYRVAAAANYLNQAIGGDLMLLGPPVSVP
jgi:hypothetical protein